MLAKEGIQRHRYSEEVTN